MSTENNTPLLPLQETIDRIKERITILKEIVEVNSPETVKMIPTYQNNILIYESALVHLKKVMPTPIGDGTLNEPSKLY